MEDTATLTVFVYIWYFVCHHLKTLNHAHASDVFPVFRALLEMWRFPYSDQRPQERAKMRVDSLAWYEYSLGMQLWAGRNANQSVVRVPYKGENFLRYSIISRKIRQDSIIRAAECSLIIKEVDEQRLVPCRWLISNDPQCGDLVSTWSVLTKTDLLASKLNVYLISFGSATLC